MIDEFSYELGKRAASGGGGGGGGTSIGDLVALSYWYGDSAPTQADADRMFNNPLNLVAIYIGNSPVISGEANYSGFSPGGCLIASGSKIVFNTGGLTQNYLVTFDDNWNIASINEYTGMNITFDPNTYLAEMIVPVLNQNEILLVGVQEGA